MNQQSHMQENISKNCKQDPKEIIRTSLLAAALFTGIKGQKQPTCPLIDEQTKKTQYIHDDVILFIFKMEETAGHLFAFPQVMVLESWGRALHCVRLQRGETASLSLCPPHPCPAPGCSLSCAFCLSVLMNKYIFFKTEGTLITYCNITGTPVHCIN